MFYRNTGTANYSDKTVFSSRPRRGGQSWGTIISQSFDGVGIVHNDELLRLVAGRDGLTNTKDTLPAMNCQG